MPDISPEPNDDLRGLLLHRLPAEAAARLEERLLLEDGFLERMQDAEYDLLDDYAADRLSAADRADVERWLLADPVGRQRARVARALRQAQSAPVDPSRGETPGLPRAAAASRRWTTVVPWAAGLAAGLLVLIFSPLRIDLGDGRPAGRASVATRGPVLPAPVATLVLLAEVGRGTVPALVPTVGEAGLVRLQAEVPDPLAGATYRIALLGTDGGIRYRSGPLALQRTGPYRFVSANVDAAMLSSAGLTIALEAVDGTGRPLPGFQWHTVAGDAGH